MNLTCININDEGIRCSNRVTLPNGHCNSHRKTIIPPLVKKKIILSKLSNKNEILLPKNKNSSPTNNIIIEDCPICLCEIDKTEEDTGLICNHKFHINCLNQIQKSECPVCRGPLEFIKNSKVDINKIKHKEKQEIIDNKQKQILEDSDLSRRIRDEEENQYHNNHHNNRHNNRHNNHHNMNVFNMMFIMEELEMQQLEMQQFNRAIENSIINF